MEAEGDSKDKENKKPCRACTDFKSWAKRKTNPRIISDNNVFDQDVDGILHEPARPDCPLDKDSLGRNTWSFLHTMAAYYPDQPSQKEEKEMTVFIRLFSKFYPCDHCAADFRQDIKQSPPETSSQSALSQWFCRMHNIVNRKLGKPEFDCKLVDERWKDGWTSGECDS